MLSWISEYGKQKRLPKIDAEWFFVNAFLLDRAPDEKLSDMIRNITTYANVQKDRLIESFRDSQQRILPSRAIIHMDVHYWIKAKQYDKVYGLLAQWYDVRDIVQMDRSRVFLSTFALSGAKQGRVDEVSVIVGQHEQQWGRDFDYWLAQMQLNATAGKSSEALKDIDAARYHIDASTQNNRPFSPWYQLLEACELLYEDTHVSAYRDKGVELARIYQRMNPFDAWAYAFEAKHTKIDSDRIRALGITLYLDKNSYRIADLNQDQKAKSLKWLEMNNPFLKIKHGQKEI